MWLSSPETIQSNLFALIQMTEYTARENSSQNKSSQDVSNIKFNHQNYE